MLKRVAVLTVSCAVPGGADSNVAEMVVLPGVRPVAMPKLFMLAIPVGEVLQVAFWVMSCVLPSVNVATRSKRCCSATGMVAVIGVTVSDTAVALVTFNANV